MAQRCHIVVLVLACLLMSACSRAQDEVVVYTALDRMFSEPILKKFEAQTGVRVLAKYDTEATKTIGLVNAIRAEKRRPRCDVFWNNEIVNTIRLKKEGLLQPVRVPAAEDYPQTFRDPDDCWVGFAARARVFLVNTRLVPEGEEPRSLFDMAKAKWRGRVGMAKPLFGTTATHSACLFALLGEHGLRAFFKSLRQNDVRICSGNKSCALSVSDGRLAFGLTDTDDAIIEIERGRPVKIIYPDSGTGELGTLFIPNTLTLIRGCPHPEAGKRLIQYLLSPDVEIALAQGQSAQIPLNRRVIYRARVKSPRETQAMKVDFGRAAAAFDLAARQVEEFFLK